MQISHPKMVNPRDIAGERRRRRRISLKYQAIELELLLYQIKFCSDDLNSVRENEANSFRFVMAS